MKDIIIAIIGMLGGILSAIVGAQWFSPDLLRLDVLIPTKEVQILDEFVYVHFPFYEERGLGNAHETYRDPSTGKNELVFDRATYVDHVWFRKTTGKYTIKLASSGLYPEVKGISPPVKLNKFEPNTSGRRVIMYELALDQSKEFHLSGITTNLKAVYVYRNSYQDKNSSGGKNVEYDTDQLTFVFDFSSLDRWEKLFKEPPKACLKKSDGNNEEAGDITWTNGVAIAEFFKLKKGDKVRVFWTWNRKAAGLPEYPTVTCEDAG